MSREFKFRAWDKGKNKMLDHFGIGGLICMEGTPFLKDIIFLQYTGLKDKNGKEIYEGDIIKQIDPYYQDKYIATVKFLGGCFKICAQYNFSFEGEGDNGSLYGSRGWEIIGNIYENPDLTQIP